MDEPLQPLQGIGVTEDDPAEGLAIEPTVAHDELRPERRHHRIELRRPRLDHVAGDLVGIDDDGPFLPEPARDRRLATADGTGQADPERVPALAHGARSSSASQASSVATSATSTSASSLVTRRSSTKFA